jgi:hypothetical protein
MNKAIASAAVLMAAASTGVLHKTRDKPKERWKR